MDKVKVACLFAGIVDCWHEWDWKPIDDNPYDYVCLKCGLRADSVQHPDPLHNDGDHWRLVKGMMEHEGWDSFCDWCIPKWVQSDKDFTPWILLSPERFITLIWDWLGQKEVQKEYGWVECPCPPEFKGDEEIDRECPYCRGSGKLPAPWLEVRLANA